MFWLAYFGIQALEEFFVVQLVLEGRVGPKVCGFDNGGSGLTMLLKLCASILGVLRVTFSKTSFAYY